MSRPARNLPRALVLAGALLAVSAPSTYSSPPANTRDDLICRAASAVGYSYHWGGSCWCKSGCSPNFGSCSAGSCSGSCPGCTHYGTYGADCSGLVNKVWQVPNPIATTTCGHGPYVAASFTSSGSYWNSISRSNLLRGDVLASSTHVLVYHYGDPWGSFVAYEAKGCSYGVVHNWRTCSSSYSAARRINITSCECTAGQVQTASCGNCGTKKRTCGSNCQWGAWSSCTGQGVCSPGSTQSTGCGNCGTASRTCTNSCQWSSWGTCTGQGVCSPGSTQSTGCGNCGTANRSCTSSCQWSSWGACTGQGPCAPGQIDTAACCDCGSQSRSCTGSCQWGGWSTCNGPDPDGGNQLCDTGEVGPCAEGRMRCLTGCLACVRAYDPIPELCDGVDNDCSGAVDDGDPTTMGATAPAYAAALRDYSFPANLAPGDTAQAWARFENMGQESWQAGQIWLASLAATGGSPSELYPSSGWPAWNVAAVLDQTVAPGETGLVSFAISAPAQPGSTIHEAFRLQDPGGALMACPSPQMEITTSTRGAGAPDDPGSAPEPQPLTSGCAIGSRGSKTPVALLLLVVALLRARPHRRRGRGDARSS